MEPRETSSSFIQTTDLQMEVILCSWLLAQTSGKLIQGFLSIKWRGRKNVNLPFLDDKPQAFPKVCLVQNFSPDDQIFFCNDLFFLYPHIFTLSLHPLFPGLYSHQLFIYIHPIGLFCNSEQLHFP